MGNGLCKKYLSTLTANSLTHKPNHSKSRLCLGPGALLIDHSQNVTEALFFLSRRVRDFSEWDVLRVSIFIFLIIH